MHKQLQHEQGMSPCRFKGTGASALVAEVQGLAGRRLTADGPAPGPSGDVTALHLACKVGTRFTWLHA